MTQIILINIKDLKKSQQIIISPNMKLQKSQLQLSSSTPDFICKLYNMIQISPQIISFSQDGFQVLIHNQSKFQQQLLPTFFRHSNWRSFVRQMNMYNFRKVNRVNQTFIFINPHFKKGNQQHYDLIKRKVNPKQQQSMIQKDYQNQLRTIISNQCQNLSIPNNPHLLHPLHSYTNHSNSLDQSIGSSITIPSLILSNLTHPQPHNLPIQLTQQKHTSQLKQQNQYQNNMYINSLTYFIDNIIIYKHQTQQILQQLNVNVEKIVKQRKILQNKNILNSFKDSLQMIDQVKNKLQSKIQNYILLQYKNNQDNNGQKNYKPHQNYLNYYLSHYQDPKKHKTPDKIHPFQTKHQPIIPQLKNGTSNGSHNNLQPQTQHHNKSCYQNHLNKLKSFNSSSSSINLIITQPTPTNDPHQLSKSNKGKKLIQIKKQPQQLDELLQQHSSINSINMSLPPNKNYFQLNTNNNTISNGNTSKYNTNPLIKNKVNNGLGLSSLCSFTSVTHLLNFDKQ